MLTKERIARIKECKKLVVKLPLETAIQLEKTENDLTIANQENERLRKAITQALEDVSDAEGELVERVEGLLLGALKGGDACL